MDGEQLAHGVGWLTHCLYHQNKFSASPTQIIFIVPLLPCIRYPTSWPPLTHPTHCLVSYHVTWKGRSFDNNFEIIVPNVHFLMLFHALHSMHCVLGITIYVLCFILSNFATWPTGRQTLSRVELLSQLSKTKPYSNSWSPVSAVIIFWKSSHFFR